MSRVREALEGVTAELVTEREKAIALHDYVRDNDKDCMLSWAKRESVCSEIWRSPIQHTIFIVGQEVQEGRYVLGWTPQMPRGS